MSHVFLIVVNGHVFKLDIHPGRNVARKFRGDRLALHVVSTGFSFDIGTASRSPRGLTEDL